MLHRPEKPASTSAASRLLRTTGLILVFFCTGLVFWKHFDGSLGGLGQPGTIRDDTGRLTHQQTQTIQDFAAALKQSFGLDFHLEISHGRPDEPDLEAEDLYLGLFPEKRRVVVVFPALLKRSLSKSALDSLQERHFEGYWSRGGWPQGLSAWMNRLWSCLADMRVPH